MGYAMWPADADSADWLVQRADLALYAAKSARASIVRYHQGIDEFDPQRLGLVAELRRAISAGDLVLHFQPKVDAVTREVVAFEALVRWAHPTNRGFLRSLAGLRAMAAQIGEVDEEERCRHFLAQLDPDHFSPEP